MTAYTYSDVLIQPKYSTIASRKDVDISSKIGNIHLKTPVITANMRTITESKMARAAYTNGAIGCLHRFNTIEDNVTEYLNSPAETIVSIGVNDEDKARFDALYEAGARSFTLDIAHGHCKKMKDMLNWIQSHVFLFDRSARQNITLIAGNIASPDAYYDMADWGADVVKVGIGPSPICKTRVQTGVGVPQLWALEQIHLQKMGMERRPHIIADGGIKYVGDIAKALKYADAVMVGSFIAGTSETPGHVFKDDSGSFYKIYQGSASGENKGKNLFVEGVTKQVPFRGKVKYFFREITDGLQSSFSYVGATNLKEFKNKCEFVRTSGSGSSEGFH